MEAEWAQAPGGGEAATKGTGGADATDGAGATGAAEGTGAPYEGYQLDLPQGEGVELDQEALGAFAKEAKKLGLDNGGANALYKIGQAALDKQAKALQAAIAKQRAAAIENWKGACRDDPEIGGAAFEESSRRAGRAYAKWATPALRQVLADSGLVQHPEIKRLFVKIDRETGDPGLATGRPPKKEPSRADIIYGTNDSL